MLLVTCIVVALSIVCSVHCTLITSTVTITSEISNTNPVVISCGYDGSSSEESVSWKYKNSTGQSSILSSNSMTINLTSTTEVGVYFCSVNKTEVAIISAVYLAAPVIQNTRDVVTLYQGDKERKLTCFSKGSFPSVDFVWKRKDEESNISVPLNPILDPNINITGTFESSILLFHNMTYNVQAVYECHVNNTAGNQTSKVLIRVKDKLAALWPFLGIVVEVVILIFIIFAYEKHSKKDVQVDLMTTTDSAEVPLKRDDDNDTELRNRVPNNNKS